MPFLEVQTSSGVDRVVLDQSAVTIGRHPKCTVVLDDDRSSRRHCLVERDAEHFWVRDLGSRNGTKLNNRRVDAERLSNGDVIKVGGVRIRFLTADAVDAPDPDEPDRASSTPATGSKRTQRRRGSRRSTLAGSGHDNDNLALALNRADHRDTSAAPTASDIDEPYERTLQTLVQPLPDTEFGASDISLVDSRGDVVHDAADASDKARDRRTEDRASAAGLRAFRMMLLACLRARATDLHIEPKVGHATVRMRVDGTMVNAPELAMDVFHLIIGLVKVLCQIDSSRKRDVQDGHFSAVLPGRTIDFRVSLTPSMHGQKLVVRILDTAQVPTRLHELGMVGWMHEKLRNVISRDAGMILAAGPTGSGKTTTLYSCLREIDVDQRNVVTIEDPVEYSIEGCTQIPVDARHGHTFDQMLRSVLRQDPDVIFVGEIRDTETATTATQAAMTGHLVLSTVHARDSIGAIFRLLDLGVEAYLVANSVSLILAQRLVRLLCPTCKRPVRPTPTQNMRMGRFIEGVATVYTPTGCPACLKTGYFGRRAIFELLECNDELRDVILAQPTIHEIRAAVGRGLFNSLQQSGFQLVAQGVTGVEEIERVAGSE